MKLVREKLKLINLIVDHAQYDPSSPFKAPIMEMSQRQLKKKKKTHCDSDTASVTLRPRVRAEATGWMGDGR